MTDKPEMMDEENVEFLSQEFGVPPEKAAELVTDNSKKAAQLGEEQLRREHESDALADVPTPTEPERDWVEDTDEERLKPVLREGRTPRSP